MRDRLARRVITENLDARRIREADVTDRRYVFPHGDRGLHDVELECNGAVVTVSGPGRTFAPGSQVRGGSHTGFPGWAIFVDAPPGKRGGSEFALEFPQPGVVDAIAVVSADPFEVAPGTQVVRLTGYGFLEDPVDIFEAVLGVDDDGERELDPEVTIGEATWISDTEVDVPVTVA